MRFICENIDEDFYMDLVLSWTELEEMRFGKMIDGDYYKHGVRFIIGCRMEGFEDYVEETD